MQKEQLNFTAIFAHYMSIDFNPHYLFQIDSEKYLIKCVDYPEQISNLFLNDLVNIQAEIEERCKHGIKLTNVKWGVWDEQS